MTLPAACWTTASSGLRLRALCFMRRSRARACVGFQGNFCTPQEDGHGVHVIIPAQTACVHIATSTVPRCAEIPHRSSESSLNSVMSEYIRTQRAVYRPAGGRAHRTHTMRTRSTAAGRRTTPIPRRHLAEAYVSIGRGGYRSGLDPDAVPLN